MIGADLRDPGDTLEVLRGCDAVVHLANIPAPGLFPPARTFNDNMAMNFNVFHAATQHGLQRVVWASSETTLGLPFATPPRYLPVDEHHYPLPTSAYALSKVASETIAEQMAGWSQIAFVALRFSNVFLPRRLRPRRRRGTTTRASGCGTCGATSTSATPRPRAGSRSRPTG